ncbi:hypothetical protein B1H10_01950 [candidate division KSB1 bacterium 4484_188]|nr:MAG: hypothetical protein B1H10_01950 [candidate division KSB1 bacterium 4484_188]
MNKKLRELLYRSFDADLKEEEKKVLADALSRSAELREEQRQIETVRQKLSATTASSFEPFFADRVMRRIYREQKPKSELESWFEPLMSIFRPIAVAAVFIILLLMSYNMISTKQISVQGALAISNVAVEEAFDPAVNLTVE